VPWELEPSHKKLCEMVLETKKKKSKNENERNEKENESEKKEERRAKTFSLRCRVYEARLSRGTTTLWHSHDRDTAYVVCGEDRETAEKKGCGEEEAPVAAVVCNETVVDGGRSLADLTLETGQAFCFLAGGRPFVHRLTFPGDSLRKGAHIVGVEVSEEEEEGRDGEKRAEATTTTSTSPSSPSSPLPSCYSLVQESRIFDFYKLKLAAGGGTTGKHRFPPEGATAAVVVAVRSSEKALCSSSSTPSSSAAWKSLSSHAGAFSVFESGESEDEMELRNEGEDEFEAVVVVL